ncbi:MAG TPA: SDR family NAD(P)-dependent oxidoreductase [Methylomirabilota bacterium]|jgi:NAD(P)-dependent dehydrogenase (short-subunit alcohol dehydrogenase family)|nr:SDR family NAD(P)-dependent oxidoreductase [Methylomirabilota bacterium]
MGMDRTRGLLAGRKALVTGAGTGIGAAITRALAREGAQVCVTDLDLARANETAGAIGAAALALKLDVTSAAETRAALDQAAERLGGLDLVCANAGVSTMNRVEDLSEEEWDFNMDVNAKGVFLTDQAALRLFKRTGVKGVIVNTASLAGKVGAPFLAHYAASKFAVVGFTQSLALEAAPLGIRVNCVCPGFVRTGMQEREILWEAKLAGKSPEQVAQGYVGLTPLGRLEEPEDVAEVVVFLASDLARYVTGEALNVTGGARMD